MRKKLIAGNWKMHLLPIEARALIAGLRAEIDRDAASLAKDREVMVAPPYVLIPAVAQALAGSSVLLGAQNMHFEEKGAFTGEVSAPMLKSYGVTHVIIGHSERRHIFHEPDELINKKVLAALRHRMVPILCVGETQDEHDSGNALSVVLRQLERGLEGVGEDIMGPVVVAYEPVWAIGTGAPRLRSRSNRFTARSAALILERYGRERASAIRIIYGGSVNPENVDSLVSKPDIDGALVGGASLKADSFARIVRARIRD